MKRDWAEHRCYFEVLSQVATSVVAFCLVISVCNEIQDAIIFAKVIDPRTIAVKVSKQLEVPTYLTQSV